MVFPGPSVLPDFMFVGILNLQPKILVVLHCYIQTVSRVHHCRAPSHIMTMLQNIWFLGAVQTTCPWIEPSAPACEYHEADTTLPLGLGTVCRWNMDGHWLKRWIIKCRLLIEDWRKGGGGVVGKWVVSAVHNLWLPVWSWTWFAANLNWKNVQRFDRPSQ